MEEQLHLEFALKLYKLSCPPSQVDLRQMLKEAAEIQTGFIDKILPSEIQNNGKSYLTTVMKDTFAWLDEQ